MNNSALVTIANSSRRVLFNTFTNINYTINSVRYSSVPDPHAPIWVDPSRLTYHCSSVRKLRGLGQVKDGEWDEDLNLRRNSWRYEGLKERFVEQLDWEETIYIEKYEKKIREEGVASGCETLDEFIDQRCSYLDRLYDNLEKQGYSRQSSGYEDTEIAKKSTRKQWKDGWEPFAAITRDGEICLSEGTHRTALSEFAGVDQIPMNVLIRHKEWQEVRDKIQQGNPDLIEDFHDHPDLEDYCE